MEGEKKMEQIQMTPFLKVPPGLSGLNEFSMFQSLLGNERRVVLPLIKLIKGSLKYAMNVSKKTVS